MQTRAENDRASLRDAAIAALCAGEAGAADRLERRRGRPIPTNVEPRPLEAILWEELAAQLNALPATARARAPLRELPVDLRPLEWYAKQARRDRGRVLAVAYWSRRRFLAQLQEWTQRADQLPRWWKTVARMDVGAFAAFCRAVGLEMIALASACEPADSLVRWLASLGHRAAQSAAERIPATRSRAIPRNLLERWHAEYASHVQRHPGPAIPEQLGLDLIGAMHARLPLDLLHAVDHLCDAQVRGRIEARQTQDLAPATDVPQIDPLLDELVAQGRPSADA